MAKSVPRSWLVRSITVTALGATLVACSTEPKTSDSMTADLATNGQSAIVGAKRSVKVRLTDNRGAGVSGAVVTWTVTNHAGATATPTSRTDTTGTASMVWTLDTLARIDSMTASTPSAPSVTITANGTAGAAFAFTKISGDNQGNLTGKTLTSPLVVAVTDRYRNGIAGASIAWSSSCAFGFNGGVPTNSYTGGPTDANGMSLLVLTMGSAKGTCAIQASINALATVVVFQVSAL